MGDDGLILGPLLFPFPAVLCSMSGFCNLRYFCAASINLVSNLKHYQSWFQSKDLFEACLRSCSADFFGGLCVLQSVS